MLEFLVTPEVSVQANNQRILDGLDDIRKYNWDDQIKEMKDIKRKTYHWEHVMPVNILYNAILSNMKNEEIIRHERGEQL
ncbi:MAG: hypothetical protein KKD38_07330 [Candidatus Delongbacteria bacterium]|nr:hypothetical protein [Candidatus Delongbacteria bacterium]MCG2760516.1 hypothetical protein [Candidatus Delongbacteria bacterium]